MRQFPDQTYPLYCYRDLKAGFMYPQVDMNDDTAKRGFAFAVNKNEGVMNFQPKDYELYRVGEFNVEKGTIESYTPVLICTGVEVYGITE